MSDPAWEGSAGFVYDLEVSPSGELYAATNGGGLLHGWRISGMHCVARLVISD